MSTRLWRVPALRWWMIALTLAYTVSGSSWFGSTLLAWHEQPFRQHEPFTLERGDQGVLRLVPSPALATTPFDAVVVLGGSTGITSSGAPQLGGAGDRLRVAAALLHSGLADRVVVTGHSIPGIGKTRNLAEEAQALLLQMQVPADRILLLDEPRNTSEELRAIADLVRTKNWQRVGLISSAWHLPRALKLARAQGVEVIPLAADFRVSPGPTHALSMIPKDSGFLLTRLWLWEQLGMLMRR